MSCCHTIPVVGNGGVIDFNQKHCIRFPPTPILLGRGSRGEPVIGITFPTVNKDVFCHEYGTDSGIAEGLNS